MLSQMLAMGLGGLLTLVPQATVAFLPAAVGPYSHAINAGAHRCGVGAATTSQVLAGTSQRAQGARWQLHSSSTTSASPSSSPAATDDDAIMDELVACPWEKLDEFASKYYKYMIHPQFYMKFADRIYQLPTQEAQDDAAAKATKIWNQLLKVLNAAEEQRNNSASILERIIGQAAEADGSFYFPLAKERATAVRAEVVKNVERFDEAMLAMLNTWVVKVQDDKDNAAMTQVLQKVFQVWAGISLMRTKGYDRPNAGPEQASAAVFLRSLLNADEEDWDMLLYSGLKQEALCSSEALVDEMAAMLQGVVLKHPEGSMTQRIQAEYLRELMSRVQRYTDSDDQSRLPF